MRCALFRVARQSYLTQKRDEVPPPGEVIRTMGPVSSPAQ